MTYQYTDASRESDPHALPDVEVFMYGQGEDQRAMEWFEGVGWYYAFGQIGCLWDSDPTGPFDTEAEALKEAREAAGFCEHGVLDETVCEACPTPELWVLREPSLDRYLIHTTTFDPTKATAMATESAANGMAIRTNLRAHGYMAVRLNDADARRWGRSD